jgi:glutaconate CoA-transferase subunit B
MAVVLSRALRDGDVVVMGTNATIPRAAALLAQRRGKPRVVTLVGAFGTVDPTTPAAPASGADPAFLPGRLASSLGTVVGDQVRGLADVIVLGALQVDRRGRLNLTVVGDYHRPALRGPGTVGLSLVASVRRTFLFLTRHDTRTFVEGVDFVSAEGLRPDGRGIDVIVTPLAVLGPDARGERIDLLSVHPGWSFADVQERTGFALDPCGARPTAAPTAEELEALRSFADGRRLAGLVVGS